MAPNPSHEVLLNLLQKGIVVDCTSEATEMFLVKAINEGACVVLANKKPITADMVCDVNVEGGLRERSLFICSQTGELSLTNKGLKKVQKRINSNPIPSIVCIQLFFKELNS